MAKYPPSKELFKEIEKKKLMPFYLFLGEEEGEKERAERAIAQVWCENPAEETARFFMQDNELLAALEFALAPSLFGGRRLCLIRGMESLSSNKKNGELLAQLKEEMPDHVITIFSSHEIKVPTLLSKNWKDLATYQFWKHFDSELTGLVRRKGKELGLTLDNAVTGKLIERSGRQIKVIEETLNTLALSGVTTVTLEDISSALRDESENNIFKAVTLLYSGDPKGVMMTKRLLEEGTPELVILKRLQWQAERLTTFMKLRAQGMSPADAMKECGIYARGTDEFLSIAGRWNNDKIQRIYPILGNTEFHLKSGGAGAQIRYIYETVEGIVRQARTR